MNGILVILEYRGAWSRISWEALTAGKELADHTGQPLIAAVATGPEANVTQELERKQLAHAWWVRHDLLSRYTAGGFIAALEQLIRKLNPAFVVFPHTYQVRDFAPRLAARFDQMLIADAIGMKFEGGGPSFVRQLLQGKLNADYRHSGGGPCFISVQAGAFKTDSAPAGHAEIEIFTPEISSAQVRGKPGDPFRTSAHTVDLTSAPLIVSVGRGIGDKDNLPIVAELAQALGAELAASRPICDNGWLPMERQVGSSGQTVSPKLYLAVGISGAIQHLVGMKGSKNVVAINKDENAPIFEIADYGIVGDLFQVVPALTAAVRKIKEG
jgi:electron transfer flavoprotein alpha subunit